MKILKNTPKRWLASISAVCLLSLLLTSCLKDKSNTYTQRPIAYLSVTQASPDALPAGFYLDGVAVNTTPLYYGNGINYISVYTGKRTTTFTGGGLNVASDTITFKENDIYSLYLANSIAHPDFIFLKDTLDTPLGGQANIRFVNVSATAPAVDLAITGGAVRAANVAYKGHTSFAPIQGDHTYSFEVRQKGTATVLATLTNVNIVSGYTYTIWLHGVPGATDATKLSLDIFNNAH